MKWDSVKIWLFVKARESAKKVCAADVDRASRLRRILFPAIKEESTTKPSRVMFNFVKLTSKMEVLSIKHCQ